MLNRYGDQWLLENPNPSAVDLSWKGFRLLSYFKKEIGIAILLSFFISLGVIGITTLSGYIFRHLPDLLEGSYGVLYLVFFMLLLASLGFSYLYHLFVKALNLKILFLMLPDLWQHLLHLPANFLKKTPSGDLAQQFSDYEMTFFASIS